MKSRGFAAQGKSTIGRTLRRFAVIGATIAACTASLAVGTAAAATPQLATPYTLVAAVPMHIVGFDAATAAKNGYQIKHTATGKEYVIKAGAPDVITPQNQIDGPCGTAFIYASGIGNKSISVFTGFTILGNVPAVAYHWHIYLRDNGGTSDHTFGGVVGGQSWSTRQTYSGLTPGPEYAYVGIGNSYAVLANTDICWAGPATSSTTIF